MADNIKNNDNVENNIPEKGPLNFLIGSLTSFSLFVFFYLLSVYKNLPHVWQIFGFLPEAKQALKEIAYFLKN